jgi:RNA polymerase sigma-70 factor, ECF subfamily
MLLYRKIHTFWGESAFSTWLHRLVVNRVLMCLRRKSLPAVSLEEPLDANEPSGPPAMDLGCRDSILEGALDRINLERCIRRLPTGYRTIFVLHDVQGYKHQEIADILGRSVGTRNPNYTKHARNCVAFSMRNGSESLRAVSPFLPICAPWCGQQPPRGRLSQHHRPEIRAPIPLQRQGLARAA